jgi:hypothetical protein
MMMTKTKKKKTQIKLRTVLVYGRPWPYVSSCYNASRSSTEGLISQLEEVQPDLHKSALLERLLPSDLCLFLLLQMTMRSSSLRK